MLGLLVLIATPVARVGMCIVGFLFERDRLYTVVSTIVLAHPALQPLPAQIAAERPASGLLDFHSVSTAVPASKPAPASAPPQKSPRPAKNTSAILIPGSRFTSGTRSVAAT